MSDIAPAPEAPPVDSAPAVDPPAPEPAAPADPAVPETDPAAAEEAIAGLEALPESWQREVRNLRAEAAKHRTAASAAKPVSEVFGQFDEGSQTRIIELLNLTATNPTAAAGAWREIADLLEGEPAAPAAPDPEADRPMTRADYDRIQAEAESKRAADSAQAAIQQEAADLGYTPGTGDYVTLLWSASNEHGGDLQKAHEAQAAKAQKVIDDYLAKKKAEAEGTPTAGSGTGAAPANDNPPKDWAGARASLEARLKATG